ncbi:Hypothetical predicted protein [Olea europaea subsp. europaea]|uniref:Uncharacterized protein n=1 Tax=Olea europaea subsp. europaea TaxID=158383 RepID=A0A8S0UBK1_OLEEU|nr:Hypothetical predicted protein [Olea europaea subsp. europaea]
MSKFLSKILLALLMREAGMSEVDEESKMIKNPNMIVGKLQIKNIENNCWRVEDDDHASKKLKENSVKKIIENKYEEALEVKLREKSLKKPVVEDPLMENDSITMSSEFSTERKRKRKSSKRKVKSNGRSGEGSSSRNNKKRRINLTEEPAPPLPIQFKNALFP